MPAMRPSTHDAMETYMVLKVNAAGLRRTCQDQPGPQVRQGGTPDRTDSPTTVRLSFASGGASGSRMDREVQEQPLSVSS